MEKELFGSIRDNYYLAAQEIWGWSSRQNLVLKIVVFPWLLIAIFFMAIIGFFFGLGIILDVMSVWLQSKRNGILDRVNDASDNLRSNPISYFLEPIIVLSLAPFILILGVIPKWSSTLAIGGHPDLDVSYSVDHGYFYKSGKYYFRFLFGLFINIMQHGKFFFLLFFLITLIVFPIIIVLSLVFFIMTILDYIGWLVGLIRKFVVFSSQLMAASSGKNILTVFLMPILLTAFVPLYVALLLIPKILTYDEA